MVYYNLAHNEAYTKGFSKWMITIYVDANPSDDGATQGCFGSLNVLRHA